MPCRCGEKKANRAHSHPQTPSDTRLLTGQIVLQVKHGFPVSASWYVCIFAVTKTTVVFFANVCSFLKIIILSLTF